MAKIYIEKKGCTSFRKFVHEHVRGSSDIYARSILMEGAGDYVYLKYFNGVVRAHIKVPLKSGLDPWRGKVLISFDSFSHLITSVSGAFVPFEITSDGLFAAIFGGRLYLTTNNLSLDCYKDQEPSDVKETTEFRGEAMWETWSSLTTMAASGTRPEERSLYFFDDGIVVCSGGVLAKSSGNYREMALQISDMRSILSLFSPTNLTVVTTTEYVEFLQEDRSFKTPRKKSLQLSDSIRLRDVDSSRGVTVSAAEIVQIAKALELSSTSSGVIRINQGVDGITMSTEGRSHNTRSEFPVEAKIVNGGLTRSTVNISASSLVRYVSPFEGEVLMDIRDSNLYLKGSLGRVVVSGRS